MNEKPLQIISKEKMDRHISQLDASSNIQSSSQQGTTRKLVLGFLAGVALSSGVAYSTKSNESTHSQPDTQGILQIDTMIKDRKVDTRIRDMLQKRVIKLEEIINIQKQIIEAQEQEIQKNCNTPKLHKLPFLETTPKKEETNI